MKNKDILILSSDDWGWKTSKYHISKRLARENRVLFVSSIGFRSPTASREHLARIVAKIRSFARGITETPEGPKVFSPLLIPFVKFPMRDAANRFLLQLQFKWHFRKLAFKPDYVFTFSQNWHPFISLFDAKIIYYCVDDQSAFLSVDAERFTDLDHRMSKAADAIFCSSRALYETKLESYPNTHYSPHGVEYDLFKKAVVDYFPVPDDIRHIASPKLLFFGHLSYDWVNSDLLKDIAKLRPEWNLILIGRNSMDSEEFSGYENILVLGERDFEDLPSYCAHCDIGLIPFVDSELVRNCNPLKLYEYLSAGLPVVSTEIPEVLAVQNESIRVARSGAKFVEECELLLNTMSKERSVSTSDSMREASWENRIARITEIIEGP